MPVYATSSDLDAYATTEGVTVPAGAAGKLRSASRLIRHETKTARYTADTAGLPTDTALLAAFRDATCAQALYWAGLGIDPVKGAAGVRPIAAQKSIGGTSIGYQVYASTAEANANAASVLGPDAWYILDDAGLLNQPPEVSW